MSFKVVNVRGQFDGKRHHALQVTVEEAVTGTLDYNPYDHLGQIELMNHRLNNQRDFIAKLTAKLIEKNAFNLIDLTELLEYPFAVRDD